MSSKKKSITVADVKKRMLTMNVVIYSQRGKFTPSEHMTHLDEIERTLHRQRKIARKYRV